VTITGCTFTGNQAIGATVPSSSSFTGSAAGRGGAVVVFNQATISGSTFSDNQAIGGSGVGEGGAVDNDGTLTVSGSTFTNNTATGGAGSNNVDGEAHGGALASYGPVTITGCTFTDNKAIGADVTSSSSFIGSATGLGGAVIVFNQATISGSTFSGNQAIGGKGISPAGNTDFSGAGEGGALFSGDGTLALTNDTFTQNKATGGAVGSNAGSNVNPGIGGAVFVGNGTLSATFDTLTSNTVTNSDGSSGTASDLYVVSAGNLPGGSLGATATIVNSILGQNSSTTVSDFFANSFNGAPAPNLSGSSNNLVSKNPPGASGLTGTLIPQGSNPIFTTGLLANNGGPTQTIALASTSAALGQGVTGTGTSTDQRGFSRPTSSSDIGAFQTPVLTSSTANLGVNATSLTINGFGFDTNAAHDTVSFSGGVTGTVTAATATQLIVTGLSGLTAGNLSASVSVNGVSSGSAVQVATVAPVLTSSTTSLAANATSLTISGFGFDTTPANDTVSFSGGVKGTVTSATATQLTVTGLSGLTGGNLNASVTVNTVSSGSTVQVATVAPVLTSSTANLGVNATSLTINGFGFDTTPANDTVSFSGGVTGTVTAATATQLTVSNLSGLTLGSLSASVTVNTVSSGSAVQVATVAPVVTSSTASLPVNATSMTINGFGFDTKAANDTVSFSGGATGTVTSATATQLTVTSLSGLAIGNLSASVSVDGVSSSSPVQVATVVPVVTSSTANLAFNATSMTINGFGFDTKAANDTVSFSGGATGIVTSATATQLTVGSLSGLTPGNLSASVSVDDVSSGSAVQVATIITRTEEFVDAAYVDVLDRHAESSSLATWGNLLDKGVVTRQQFASSLTHSAEYYSNFITHAYQTYLGRLPDQAGLKTWVQAMQNGLSDEHLEAGFIGSPEYIAKHGGAGAGWVTGMYQDLLGRTPSQDEVNEWVKALEQGVTTQQVAYGFAASAERETMRVQNDYQTYLGRSASPSEVKTWVNAFLQGVSNEDVIAGFVGSDEYFGKHTT
jgi:hypothetical protein